MSPKDLLKLEIKLTNLLKNVEDDINKSFSKTHEEIQKDARDLSTDTDIRVENSIKRILSQLLPNAGFVVEEGKSSESSTLNWLIDPIDGTKNFASKLPLFYTQIALLKNDTPILGLISNPISKHTFSASLGNGARLNGESVVPNKREKHASIIDIDLGDSKDFSKKVFKIFNLLSDSFYRVRASGGSFAPYILTGAIDAYIVFGQRIKPMDIVPRQIIMQEAGLKVNIINIENNKIFLAANNQIFPSIERIILKTFKKNNT